MFYFDTTPFIVRMFYPGCIWNFNRKEQVLYLTFDDGPHPEATPFVLDLLKRYNARATFFCIGKNVAEYPDIYRRIIDEGHAVGNHTHHHVNGKKVADDVYLQDIREAAKWIDSKLFRPPYGRISHFQLRVLTGKENIKQREMFSVVMWDVLSADFDVSLSAGQCAKKVIRHAREGSIIVFHDSAKALPRLQGALEKTLDHFSKKGFSFQPIRL